MGASYLKLLTKIATNKKKYPEWREGQCVFNSVSDLFSEISDKYRGGALDPFYKDHRIDLFLKSVQKDLQN